MTTYTTIADGDIDQDSPITQPLMLAMRDNPLAIIDGSSGAPKIQLGAFSRVTAGPAIRAKNDTVQSTVSTSYSEAYSFAFLQAGQIRVTFLQNSTGGTVIVRRWIAGSFLDVTFVATGGVNIARSTDVQVLPGTLIQVLHKSNSGSTSTVSFIRFQTNGEDLWPGSSYQVEGNIIL